MTETRDSVSSVVAAILPSATEVANVRPKVSEVFQAEYSYVSNTLRRLGVREADLEDVAHEVFLAVHRRLSTYDPSRPLRPWLFGIAFRAASDYRRLARHHREVSDEHIDVADDAPGADDHVFARQARELVGKALDVLDLDKRAVLVMCDIDGHSVPEIAAALNIPLNTAYSRLRLARAQFTSVITALEGGKR